jgi:hypothetical protein
MMGEVPSCSIVPNPFTKPVCSWSPTVGGGKGGGGGGRERRESLSGKEREFIRNRNL